MIIKKPFYFLRHGQTDANLRGLFSGREDPPLNAKGVKQAKELIPFLERHKDIISAIYVSCLTRAKMTAKIACKSLELEHEQIDGLHECDFGVLENNIINEDTDRQIEEWLIGKTPNGAEPYQNFYHRVENTINRCLETSDGAPLFVSHGGVFMTLSNQLGWKEPLELKNCELVYVAPDLSLNFWKIQGINIARST